MATRIDQGRGKLYQDGSEQSVAGIDYQLHEELTADPVRWWGEFTFTRSVAVRENDRYIIELEDGRKGNCRLKKLV